MTQLDRLEVRGLVVRRSDPRARIPEITWRGRTLRENVASAWTDVEVATPSGFDKAHVQLLRRMLFEIIGNAEHPGSCL
ncbi:hypothetical protein [Mycobacterium sp. 050134]|uniref:hypothetical protein n=1 Tax=Mycobacterium sp. 050134 TaxID=3096111 RepID=UPI002ED9C181